MLIGVGSMMRQAINFILNCVILLLLFRGIPVQAGESEQRWAAIHEAFFKQRVVATTELIQVIAPLGAENAAQVPVTLIAKNQINDAIKKIYLFIDANPLPLAASYYFPNYFNELVLSTRVRLDSDSKIRAIAEMESGALLMAFTQVNAGGGCAGAVDDNEDNVRNHTGEMRFQLNPPYKMHEVVSATLQVRHPMYTGLQIDAKTKKVKPAYFIETLNLSMNELKILEVNFGVGTAENPYLNFKFDLPTSAYQKDAIKMKVQAIDNEAKTYIQEF